MAGGDPHELSIRVQVLGGQWETIGADRYRGVIAENVQATANDWGPDTASFTLRRDPAAVHPDLIAWTPVEIWVAGVLAWDGRVKETPAQEGADFSLNVQCEGWQYHLDDDVYSQVYVRTRLSDYVDERSLPTANLATHPQYGQIQQDGGSILLSIPNGTAVTSGHGVGVVIDLGPGNAAKRAVVTTASSANTAIAQVFVIGSDTPAWSDADANRGDYVSGQALNSSNGVTSAGTTASSHRYVTLLLWMTGAGTFGADVWVRFTSVQLFADTAYESGSASILKADQIVKDTLTQATVLLSSDLSEIKAGTFSIPEFATSGYQTPREAITAANAYENYETKLLPGRRLAFRPRASAPIYEIGEWSGADFADASTNSGDDIFNKVAVQGTGPDGQPLNMVRYASQQLGVTLLPIATPVPDNPGFEVNTLSWTPSGSSTITRDTAVFDSGVASGRWDSIAVGNTLTETFTGTFAAHSQYRLDVWIRAGNGVNPTATASLGTATDRSTNSIHIATIGWTRLSMVWYPTVASTSVTLVLTVGVATSAWVDSLALYQAKPTLPDRWGFNHSTTLPVESAMTTPAAQRIGDLYLAAHKTTPFRGAFSATPGGVRRILGGAAPHPAWLLADAGQVVRVGKTDPDTGAWGRIGTIAAVSYDHDSLTASVSLDENRAGFAALLSRLAVVTGQRSTG